MDEGSEQVTATVIDAKTLRTGLTAVWHAVAEEEARPVLATICWKRNGDKLRLVAADNWRLSFYDMPTFGMTDLEQFETPMLLRRDDVKGLRYWLRPLKGQPITIERTGEDFGQRVRFSWDYGAVEFRLMEGTYPAYEQIIPKERAASIAINPLYLAEAGAAFVNAGVGLVGIELGGPLESLVLRAASSPIFEMIMPVRAPELTSKKADE